MNYDSGYTLKVKKLSVQTSSVPGAVASIPHGLDASDFIRVTGALYFTPSQGINPGYTDLDGYLYYVEWTPTHLEVITIADSSASILNKRCEITIFYKD